jgi:hypothetical protein
VTRRGPGNRKRDRSNYRKLLVEKGDSIDGGGISDPVPISASTRQSGELRTLFFGFKPTYQGIIPESPFLKARGTVHRNDIRSFIAMLLSANEKCSISICLIQGPLIQGHLN